MSYFSLEVFCGLSLFSFVYSVDRLTVAPAGSSVCLLTFLFVFSLSFTEDTVRDSDSGVGVGYSASDFIHV